PTPAPRRPTASIRQWRWPRSRTSPELTQRSMHNVSFIKGNVMQVPVRAPDPARRPVRRAIPGSIAAGASDLSVAFEGLANPTRLRIVESLAGAGEMRGSELADLHMV